MLSKRSSYVRASPVRHYVVKISSSVPSPFQIRKPFRYEGRQPLSTSTIRCNNIGQQAPSAYTYIESRATDGDRKSLVDVKKVLMIGSGGLSIG